MTELPQSLPGHWESEGGREMARLYATKQRGELVLSDVSDLALANLCFLEGNLRNQTAAKDRIRWLSVQLALVTGELDRRVTELLEANNREVEHRREVENRLKDLQDRLAKALGEK